MTTLREAAQQALEALENNLEGMKADWYQIDQEWGPSQGGLQAAIDGTLTGYEYFQETITAIAALRAALAQQEEPAQEPAAWIYQNANTDSEYLVWRRSKGGRNWRPLYTAPPLPKPQTLNDVMQQPRAMAQAYENGYSAGVAHEREACATACEHQPHWVACAAAIRARNNP